MFVKIRRKDANGEWHETIFDCKRASIHPHPDPETGELMKDRLLLVTDVGEQDERTNELGTDLPLELIYMNSQGKTIDRKVW